MNTAPVYMSDSKASRLAEMLRVNQKQPQSSFKRIAVYNTGADSITPNVPILITAWHNPDYAKCKRLISTQRGVFNGYSTNKPTGVCSHRTIKAHMTGKCWAPDFIIQACDCTNELATTGADWYYADANLNLVPDTSSASAAKWAVLAKSYVGDTNYRVCALIPLYITDSAASGPSDTITYCSAVAVSSGNLVFTFTQKDVLVP